MIRLVIFLFLLSFSLFAQEDAIALDSNSVQVEMHKENYFFPYYKSNPKQLGASQSSEVKFQISFKFQVLKFDNSSLNLAYTQKSFWQVYDADKSRPFREHNYNPEIFYRYGSKSIYLDLGIEHESNGEKDPESRSWDRAYLRVAAQSSFFRFSYKLWSILSEENYGDLYLERDESMKYYYGTQEFDLGFQLGRTIFKSRMRYNFSTEKGYHESMMLYPFFKKLLFGVSYSKGYGNNLRVYNRKHETYGIGFLINP